MSDEKALALRLADAIWPWPGISILADGQAKTLSLAAAELRRQHEEIQSLRNRLAKQRPTLWALKDNPGITTHSRPQMEKLWDALGPMV
jgi:hypothetical protein